MGNGTRLVCEKCGGAAKTLNVMGRVDDYCMSCEKRAPSCVCQQNARSAQ